MAEKKKDRPRWVLHGGNLTLVSEFSHLPPKKRPEVYCPCCGRQVVMKLGQKVVHHFAHKVDCDCVVNDPESALHLNTKVYIGKCLEGASELFVDLFCSGFPKLRHSCQIASPFRLVSDWDEVKIECSFGTFRPDVGLFREGKLICAIEICATHPIPDEKIERFEQEEVAWLEVKASSELFEGDAAWTPDKSLELLRGSPLDNPPQWNCVDCLQRKEEFEWRKRNHIKVRHELAVDLFFPSGKSYRELFRVWEKVVDAKAVELWLTRQNLTKFDDDDFGGLYSRIEEQMGQSEFAPITRESTERLTQLFQNHLELRRRKHRAIVDYPMGWKPSRVFWGGATKREDIEERYFESEEPLLCDRQYPKRYIWSEKNRDWFMPRHNKEMNWDDPNSVMKAKAAQKESLKQWKRKKIEKEYKERKRFLRSIEEVVSESNERVVSRLGRGSELSDFGGEVERPKITGWKPEVSSEVKQIKRFMPPEGTCVFCSDKTTKWWWFDGASKSCKCNSCKEIGLL